MSSLKPVEENRPLFQKSHLVLWLSRCCSMKIFKEETVHRVFLFIGNVTVIIWQHYCESPRFRLPWLPFRSQLYVGESSPTYVWRCVHTYAFRLVMCEWFSYRTHRQRRGQLTHWPLVRLLVSEVRLIHISEIFNLSLPLIYVEWVFISRDSVYLLSICVRNLSSSILSYSEFILCLTAMTAISESGWNCVEIILLEGQHFYFLSCTVIFVAICLLACPVQSAMISSRLI